MSENKTPAPPITVPPPLNDVKVGGTKPLVNSTEVAPTPTKPDDKNGGKEGRGNYGSFILEGGFVFTFNGYI